jgi:hypothetical protein
MQSLTDTSPILGSDASLELVISHPIQPTVQEVVMLMQYLVDTTLLLGRDKSKELALPLKSSVNTTLLLGGDAYFDHVFSVSSSIPSTQGIIPLSSSTLPPCPRVVSFYWNNLV